MWNNGGKKLLSKLRNVVRNYVEGQRIRRKQGWKAGDGMMRRIARLGRRLNMCNGTGEENDKVGYKTVKGKAKRVVARVKADSIEGPYDQLETV